jgi:hypothetical protein
MTGTSLKHRLARARLALDHTLQKILDINKRRKNRRRDKTEQSEIELRILNKMAQTHAVLVRLYERRIAERLSPSMAPTERVATPPTATGWRSDDARAYVPQFPSKMPRHWKEEGGSRLGIRPDSSSNGQKGLTLSP